MINGSPFTAPPMFSVISPATINIQPTTFAELGSYTMQVEIFDYQPYSSFTYFGVTVTNAAPIFLNNQTMKNQKIPFNNTFEYLLPSYGDPEGSPVYLSQSSQPNIIH